MKRQQFFLELLPNRYAVCRLSAQSTTPQWLPNEDLTAIVRTSDELSIVCREEYVPDGITSEREWRVIKIRGPLDFSEIGVIANLSTILAQARVGIFVLSTFDTDYILVKELNLDSAIEAFEDDGHQVVIL
jgi:hypothetical protein